MLWLLPCFLTGGMFSSLAQYELTMDGRTIEINEDLYQDAKGSPYFNDQWQKGNLITAGGKVYKGMSLKYDVFTGQVHYLQDRKVYTPVEDIREFHLTAGKSPGTVFRKGFPDTGKGNANTWYQVLYEGKILLLKLNRKLIVEKRDPFTSGLLKTFTAMEDYYAYDQETAGMQELVLNKHEFFRLFGSQREKVKKWAEQRKLKLKEEDDLIKLFRYYDHL